MTDVTPATTVADEYAPPAPQPPQEKTYFGEVVLLDSWDCVLEKGKGKVIFDPSQHPAYRKVKAIKISVECRSRDDSPYTIDMDVISDSKEWRITYPTIGAIGRTVPTLIGSLVQVKRAPTGEYYTNKTTGEQKPKTTFKFIAAYPDRGTMTAAADLFYTPRAARLENVDFTQAEVDAEIEKQFGPAPTPAPVTQIAAASQAWTPPTPITPVTLVTPAAAAPAPVATIDRATAATFLPMFWAQVGQDKGKFYQAVKTNPVTAPHFADHTAAEMVQYLGADFDPNLPF